MREVVYNHHREAGTALVAVKTAAAAASNAAKAAASAASVAAADPCVSLDFPYYAVY